MYKKLLPICLVFIIPLVVLAQNKQSNNAGGKERVVLVTVEKVSVLVKAQKWQQKVQAKCCRYMCRRVMQ